jgi:hypothetical protein
VAGLWVAGLAGLAVLPGAVAVEQAVASVPANSNAAAPGTMRRRRGPPSRRPRPLAGAGESTWTLGFTLAGYTPLALLNRILVVLSGILANLTALPDLKFS